MNDIIGTCWNEQQFVKNTGCLLHNELSKGRSSYRGNHLILSRFQHERSFAVHMVVLQKGNAGKDITTAKILLLQSNIKAASVSHFIISENKLIVAETLAYCGILLRYF